MIRILDIIWLWFGTTISKERGNQTHLLLCENNLSDTPSSKKIRILINSLMVSEQTVNYLTETFIMGLGSYSVLLQTRDEIFGNIFYVLVVCFFWLSEKITLSFFFFHSLLLFALGQSNFLPFFFSWHRILSVSYVLTFVQILK